MEELGSYDLVLVDRFPYHGAVACYRVLNSPSR